MLRDLDKGWNQSSPSSWSVSRLERSEPKPEVELLEKKSESSRVSRSLGRIEFLLDSFLDFCSLSSSFSFSLAAASCFELCTPWERNEFCSGTISNFWLISPLWLPWWCFSKRKSSRAKLSLLLGYFLHAWEKKVNHGKQMNSYSQRFLITLSSNSALCLVCFSLGWRLAIS